MQYYVLSVAGCRGVKVVTQDIRHTFTCSYYLLNRSTKHMMLFRLKRMSEALIRGSPLGAIGYASAKGWMDNALFVKYTEHLIQYTKPSEANKILLVFEWPSEPQDTGGD